ncbi:MAG: hypothetical protein HDT44_00475 [Ruminococcaceae bacterium]|nr:hypothetical protein [Oscillospiraceae bacterium]
MGIFRRAAAISIAAALTASMSMTAYAQDVVTDTERALIFTVENCGIAEGYEDEAKAIFNYFENTGAVFYGDVLDRVLTDDTMITINSGRVDVSAAKYGYFQLFKFSEDKTTLVLKDTIKYHSHMEGGYDYCWSICGDKGPRGGSYEEGEEIDGCKTAKCEFDETAVLGNKISGGLIRKIVDQSYVYDDKSNKLPYDLNDFDLINVCFYYETGIDNGDMFYSLLTDSYVKANPVQPKPDEPAEETYKVTADKPFTDEEFAAILEENKTKDVEITVDGVTYTFKKGEMEAVDGAEYDFGVTITTDLSKLENADKALTEDNFVLHIDYNYSGKLPATASIKLFVGKEYAGKTLYYSQVLENGIKLIQSAAVDNDGYITVTQDHCSEYVLTTEELKNEEGTSDNTTTAPSTPDDTTAAPANPDKEDNPNTGVGSVAVVTGMAVIAAGTVMILGKKRK